jgi:hypothetical protein
VKRIIHSLHHPLVLIGLGLAVAGVALVYSGARHKQAYQKFEHCIAVNVRPICTLTTNSSHADLPAEEYREYYKSQFTFGWGLLGLGVAALLLAVAFALRRRGSPQGVETMNLSPDQLRLHYQSLTDKALLAAHGLGPDCYQPEVWQVLKAEVETRGAQLGSEEEASVAQSIQYAEPIPPSGSVQRGKAIVTAIVVVAIVLSLAVFLIPGPLDRRIIQLCVTIALCGNLYRGKNWARITAGVFAAFGGLLVACLSVVLLLRGSTAMSTWSQSKVKVFAAYILVTSVIYLWGAVLLFFSPHVRAFTRKEAGSVPQA